MKPMTIFSSDRDVIGVDTLVILYCREGILYHVTLTPDQYKMIQDFFTENINPISIDKTFPLGEAENILSQKYMN